MLTYLAYRLVSAFANRVPRSFGNWLALRTADAHYFLRKAPRDGARSNLRVILGPNATPTQLQYQLRWTFRCFGKYMLEFLGPRRFDAFFIDRFVTFKGLEHLDQALSAGRGAVMVSAHLANWELCGAALSHRGVPVLAVVKPHPNPRVHRLFMRQRESHNFRVLPVGQAALPVLRHLKGNGVAAILGDRPYGEEGVEVEFFGRPARFPSGPARLALATGAAFLPFFILRRFDDSFQMVVEPPIPHPEDIPRRERARHMTQSFARVMESYVRENPSQWLTFYPVWEPAR